MPTHEVDFEELLREHLDELELHRFSKDNRRLAERAMELLFEHLRKAGVSDIRQVDENHLVSFINSLKEMEGTGRQTDGSFHPEHVRFGNEEVLQVPGPKERDPS